MTTALAALMTFAIPPGPLDAYTVNYRETKVATRFEYKVHIVDSLPSNSPEHHLRRDWEPASEPILSVSGLWEGDGNVEHIIVRQDGIKEAKSPSALAFPLECLFDRSIFALRSFKDRPNTIQLYRTQTPVVTVYGPFLWWGVPMASILESDFAGNRPVVQALTQDGATARREIYENRLPKSRVRLVITYDPNIGYLPRYIRGYSCPEPPASGPTSFKELHLVASKACPSGGFLPTEWVDTFFQIKDFDPNSPNYRDDSVLRPSTTVQIDHFKVLSVSKLTGRLVITDVDGLDTILSAEGGLSPLPSNPGPLSLPRILEIAKRRPSKVIPSSRGASRSNRSERGTRWLFDVHAGWFIAIAIVSAGFSLYMLRKSTAAMVIPLILSHGLLGCSSSGTTGLTIPRIAVKPEQESFLYSEGDAELQLKLILANEWDHPLSFTGADGGCSCRLFDKGAFPFTLRPSEKHPIGLRYRPTGMSKPVIAQVMLKTTIGNLPARFTVDARPKHRMVPNSYTAQLGEGVDDSHSLELVHEQTVRRGTPFEAVLLTTPANSDLSIISRTDLGVSEFDTDVFQTRRTRYSIAIRSTQLGLHKEIVRLLTINGRPLLEVPIVWHRTAFMSSMPERVILSSRPIRVFLRCEDDSVEFGRVVLTPIGVKVTVSSPRQLTVEAGPDSPEILDGILVVSTTFNEAEIKIPVVRYAPKDERRGATSTK